MDPIVISRDHVVAANDSTFQQNLHQAQHRRKLFKHSYNKKNQAAKLQAEGRNDSNTTWFQSPEEKQSIKQKDIRQGSIYDVIAFEGEWRETHSCEMEQTPHSQPICSWENIWEYTPPSNIHEGLLNCESTN